MIKKIVVAALFLLILISAQSFALDNEYSRESLRGIPGVRVIVEEFDMASKDIGLDTAVIQADVEERLEKAGIRVFSNDEWLNTSGSPYLYININVIACSDQMSMSYRIALNQTVTLTRDSQTQVVAETWSTGGIASSAKSRAVEFALKANARYTDKFIRAYKSVN